MKGIFIIIRFSRLVKTFIDEEIDNGKYICKNSSDEIVETKIYYNLMLIATENPLSNQNIKLYLSSYDGQGVNIIFNIIGILYEISCARFLKKF